MPSADQAYNAMQAALTKAQSYTPANSGDVLSDLMGRVGYMKPQYEELAGLQQQAAQTPAAEFQSYKDLYPQGGPSAMRQMSSVLGEVGRRYGTADVLSNLIDAQRGRIGQMAQDVGSQYGALRDSAWQSYQAQVPIWQTAVQQEEAARSRAAAAAQYAALSGGGGGDIGQGGPTANDPYASERPAYIAPGGAYNGRTYPQGATLTGADAFGYRQSLQKSIQNQGQKIAQGQGLMNYGQNISKPMAAIGSLGIGPLLGNIFGWK